MNPIVIATAFFLGLAASRVGLPPLVGFLLAGFVLHELGIESTVMLQVMADFGVTLLLFTIGLKLKLSTLLRREVWGTATIHATSSTLFFGAVLLGLGSLGIPLVEDLGWQTALILGFGLSFSSTVFAVKSFEERAESAARHAAIAIGILIVQDIFAVGFAAASAGKPPSPWALLLLALPLVRRLFTRLMDRVGHGEVMVLFGFVMALFGYFSFEAVGLKGDLGALVFGMLLAHDPKSDEVSKALLAFKDLFLVGFFLTIGLDGNPSGAGMLLAFLLVALVPLKSALFFLLQARFGLRARTSLLCALGLSNFSEFGLIVTYTGIKAGWLPPEWLPVIGVVIALSLLAATPVNVASHRIYERFSATLRRFERPDPIDQPEPIPPADAIVFGMGRVGSGAYEELCEHFEGSVLGVDLDPAVVAAQREAGRQVIQGDVTDLDFWARCRPGVKVVLLAMSDHSANLFAAEQIRRAGGRSYLAATAKFPDQGQELEQAGADAVFNFYANAGAGLAEHAIASVR